MKREIPTLLSEFTWRRRRKLGHVFARVVQAADKAPVGARGKRPNSGRKQRGTGSGKRPGLLISTFAPVSGYPGKLPAAGGVQGNKDDRRQRSPGGDPVHSP